MSCEITALDGSEITLMDVGGVVALAMDLANRYADNIPSVKEEAFWDHLGNSYGIALILANSAIKNYPAMKSRICPEEIALAAGLHDVGCALKHNQLFHELRSARYILDNWRELEITSDRSSAFRIAQMVVPHLVIYEQWLDPANEEMTKEFAPIDPILLLPRTWPEAIVMFAGLASVYGELESYRRRLDEIREGARTLDFTSAEDPTLKAAIEKGYSRVLATCERVYKMHTGELDPKLACYYGVL